MWLFGKKIENKTIDCNQGIAKIKDLKSKGYALLASKALLGPEPIPTEKPTYGYIIETIETHLTPEVLDSSRDYVRNTSVK